MIHFPETPMMTMTPTHSFIERHTVPNQERKAGTSMKFASHQTILKTLIIGREYNGGTLLYWVASSS